MLKPRDRQCSLRPHPAHRLLLCLTSALLPNLGAAVGLAQIPGDALPAPPLQPDAPQLLAQSFQRPAPAPQPDLRPQPLPPADELLKSPSPTPPGDEIKPGEGAVTVVVKQFKVVGSTVFSDAQLQQLLQPFTNRPLTLTELLQARSIVTQLYLDAGYPSSGAYIPPQDPQEGVITIQVIEGRVTEINVTGNRRLQANYIRSRVALGAEAPLNIHRLVERLRLLKLNPLLKNISAELAAGVQPGTSILMVKVEEAPSLKVDLAGDNYRSPAIGTWEGSGTLKEANLLGWGDRLTVGYIGTQGSGEVDVNYTLPVSPRDATLSFNVQTVRSRVVEDPFTALDIHSRSQYYSLTYRHPIIQTPTEEFALSLTGAYAQSRSEFLGNLLGEAIPFPSFGADANGKVQVATVRFGQEWLKQGKQQVLALRSQFNVGFVPTDPLITDNAPNKQFFDWQGQVQWVKLLAPDTLLLLRSQLQLTGNSLTSLEQFTLGGWQSVRGYRQDQFFTDNGLQASAELRLPLYRAPTVKGLLQGIVFLDAGTGWNVQQPNPDPNVLVGIGVGLQWLMGDRLTARFDYGIPLINAHRNGESLQDQGFYFSLRYTPF